MSRKNLIADLEFDTLPEAERYAKHNRCAICFGHWNVNNDGRTSERKYFLECPSCKTRANDFNSTHKANIERINSDRGFAKSELRPHKKLTDAEAEENLKALGF